MGKDDFARDVYIRFDALQLPPGWRLRGVYTMHHVWRGGPALTLYSLHFGASGRQVSAACGVLIKEAFVTICYWLMCSILHSL